MAKIQLYYFMTRRYGDILCAVVYSTFSPCSFYTVSVLTMSTGPLTQDQQNFVRTSNFFSFYLELYMKINQRIQFGPVNKNVHFEDCLLYSIFVLFCLMLKQHLIESCSTVLVAKISTIN